MAVDPDAPLLAQWSWVRGQGKGERLGDARIAGQFCPARMRPRLIEFYPRRGHYTVMPSPAIYATTTMLALVHAVGDTLEP